MIWSTVGLLFTKFGNLINHKNSKIQASNISLAPYLKLFDTSPSEIVMIDKSTLRQYLPNNSLYFPLWQVHQYASKELLRLFLPSL